MEFVKNKRDSDRLGQLLNPELLRKNTKSSPKRLVQTLGKALFHAVFAHNGFCTGMIDVYVNVN